MKGLLLPLLLLVTIATAMGAAYARHESRKLFLDLQRLEGARDDMNVEWGQLQLEQSTYTRHGNVEAVARERLDMRSPRPDQIVILRP
ncbi:MAG: cell division protein FtsL [Thiogranum sp.]|nr:cell division protein FtsL [Thiogranum sp.]